MQTHTAPVSSIQRHCNADECLQHLESVYREHSNFSITKVLEKA